MKMDEKLQWALTGVPARIGVGLSGGADSVALLLALVQRGKPGLFAVHVNHGLRGEMADRDEDFCRGLCGSLGVPLKVYRLILPQGCGENRSRTDRYGAYQIACDEEGCDTIALAHHRDDQAETFLLRLLRGSGTRGLGALRFEQRWGDMRVFRPLLTFTHQELCDWLTDKGQPWVEDETNGEPRYLRNRVRHELLPLMEDLVPGAAERIAQTAALLQEDEDALTGGWADELLARNSGDLWLRLGCVDQTPEAVKSRILRHWWEDSPANCAPERCLSVEQTDALAALLRAKPGTRCNLPSDWRAERGEQYLHLLPPENQDTVSFDLVNGLRCGGLILHVKPFRDELVDGKTAMAVPRPILEQCRVRSMQLGDRITPVNSGHSRPLREFLRDRSVEVPFRRWMPLLCRGQDVLMVPGVGRADVPAAEPGEEIVLLQWTGPMPWIETEDR